MFIFGRRQKAIEIRRSTRPAHVDQQSPVRLTEMLRCIYSNPTRGLSKSCFFERRLGAASLRLGRAIDRTWTVFYRFLLFRSLPQESGLDQLAESQAQPLP